MLVWVVGKDGLVGRAVVSTLGLPLVASGRTEADVTDYSSLKSFYERHKPTHIINCTALVQVDQAEGALASVAKSVNVDGARNLARIAQEYGAKFVHVSTDYVFDGTKSVDYVEEDQVNPVNVYGKTKLAGEKAVLEEFPFATIVRTASLFGPYKEGLIDSMVKLLQTKERCSFVIDQTSTPTHVDDLTAAIGCVLEQSGIFHFVNQGSCSRFELLEYILGLMKKYGLQTKCKELVKTVQKDFPRPAIRPVRSVLSTKKIETYLDFEIRSWKEAVGEMFKLKWVKG